MGKDQIIGALILIVCAVVIVGYLAGLFLYDPYIISVLNVGSAADVRFWLIATPVLVGFVAILGIGTWIGYTMATTPPPKTIEEINAETKTEETNLT
jgi:hypothetical protein